MCFCSPHTRPSVSLLPGTRDHPTYLQCGHIPFHNPLRTLLSVATAPHHTLQSKPTIKETQPLKGSVSPISLSNFIKLIPWPSRLIPPHWICRDSSSDNNGALLCEIDLSLFIRDLSRSIHYTLTQVLPT